MTRAIPLILLLALASCYVAPPPIGVNVGYGYYPHGYYGHGYHGYRGW